MLACERVGELFWLAEDLQEPCMTGRHLALVILICVPQIMLYVIGLPLGALLVLRRNKNNLYDESVQFRFGLLYAGYRHEIYWWELSIVVRKVALVIVGGVFGSRLGPDMQVYLALALVMLFIVAHLAMRPFDELSTLHTILHWLELGALVVCWGTLYCGMLFWIGDRISAGFRVFVSFFIVGLNILFTLFIIAVYIRANVLENKQNSEYSEDALREIVSVRRESVASRHEISKNKASGTQIYKTGRVSNRFGKGGRIFTAKGSLRYKIKVAVQLDKAQAETEAYVNSLAIKNKRVQVAETLSRCRLNQRLLLRANIGRNKDGKDDADAAIPSSNVGANRDTLSKTTAVFPLAAVSKSEKSEAADSTEIVQKFEKTTGGFPSTRAALSLTPSDVEKARIVWVNSVSVDHTALVFSKMKPKGNPEKASKKTLAVLFVKKLKVKRGVEILELLQDNPKAKFVERTRFEAWLRGHDRLVYDRLVSNGAHVGQQTVRGEKVKEKNEPGKMGKKGQATQVQAAREPAAANSATGSALVKTVEVTLNPVESDVRKQTEPEMPEAATMAKTATESALVKAVGVNFDGVDNGDVTSAEIKKARTLWIQSVPVDQTALVFAKIKPKGNPNKASKKTLALIFVKKLKVKRGEEILTLLQTNPKAKFVERARFEAWLRGQNTFVSWRQGAPSNSHSRKASGRQHGKNTGSKGALISGLTLAMVGLLAMAAGVHGLQYSLVHRGTNNDPNDACQSSSNGAWKIDYEHCLNYYDGITRYDSRWSKYNYKYWHQLSHSSLPPGCSHYHSRNRYYNRHYIYWNTYPSSISCSTSYGCVCVQQPCQFTAGSMDNGRDCSCGNNRLCNAATGRFCTASTPSANGQCHRGCSPGTYASGASASCNPCEPGAYCSGGRNRVHSNKFKCSAGKWSDEQGLSSANQCKSCAQGKWSSSSANGITTGCVFPMLVPTSQMLRCTWGAFDIGTNATIYQKSNVSSVNAIVELQVPPPGCTMRTMVTLDSGDTAKISGTRDASPLHELAAASDGLWDAPPRHFVVSGSAKLQLAHLRLTRGRVSSHTGVGGSILVTGPSAELQVYAVSFSGFGALRLSAFRGGAIAAENGAHVVIDGSTFRDYRSKNGGGAIFASGLGTSVSIFSTSFDNNQAVHGAGGAVYSIGPAKVLLGGGNSFSGNSAESAADGHSVAHVYECVETEIDSVIKIPELRACLEKKHVAGYNIDFVSISAKNLNTKFLDEICVAFGYASFWKAYGAAKRCDTYITYPSTAWTQISAAPVHVYSSTCSQGVMGNVCSELCEPQKKQFYDGFYCRRDSIRQTVLDTHLKQNCHESSFDGHISMTELNACLKLHGYAGSGFEYVVQEGKDSQVFRDRVCQAFDAGDSTGLYGQSYCSRHSNMHAFSGAFSSALRFSTTGPCTASGNCFRSPNYPNSYNNNDACTITALASGTLSSTTFSTESRYDVLRVDGRSFSGTTGPNGLSVTTSSSITFAADSSYTSSGFEICMIDAGPVHLCPVPSNGVHIWPVQSDKHFDCYGSNKYTGFTCQGHGHSDPRSPGLTFQCNAGTYCARTNDAGIRLSVDFKSCPTTCPAGKTTPTWSTSLPHARNDTTAHDFFAGIHPKASGRQSCRPWLTPETACPIDCPAGMFCPGALNASDRGCVALMNMKNDENENACMSKYGDGMRACFSIESWNQYTKKWKSAVGSYVASSVGTTAVKTDSVGTHGLLENDVEYLSGTTSTQISFGQIKGPGTFCSMTRYTGATKRLLLTGDGNYWLHGHWHGRAGVAHYGGWVTGYGLRVIPNTNWITMCLQHNGAREYLNGKVSNVNVRSGISRNVYINAGPHGGQTTDWGAAFIVSWDYDLNAQEVQKVGDFIRAGAISDVAPTACLACSQGRYTQFCPDGRFSVSGASSCEYNVSSCPPTTSAVPRGNSKNSGGACVTLDPCLFEPTPYSNLAVSEVGGRYDAMKEDSAWHFLERDCWLTKTLAFDSYDSSLKLWGLHFDKHSQRRVRIDRGGGNTRFNADPGVHFKLSRRARLTLVDLEIVNAWSSENGGALWFASEEDMRALIVNTLFSNNNIKMQHALDSVDIRFVPRNDSKAFVALVDMPQHFLPKIRKGGGAGAGAGLEMLISSCSNGSVAIDDFCRKAVRSECIPSSASNTASNGLVCHPLPRPHNVSVECTPITRPGGPSSIRVTATIPRNKSLPYANTKYAQVHVFHVYSNLSIHMLRYTPELAAMQAAGDDVEGRHVLVEDVLSVNSDAGLTSDSPQSTNWTLDVKIDISHDYAGAIPLHVEVTACLGEQDHENGGEPHCSAPTRIAAPLIHEFVARPDTPSITTNGYDASVHVIPPIFRGAGVPVLAFDSSAFYEFRAKRFESNKESNYNDWKEGDVFAVNISAATPSQHYDCLGATDTSSCHRGGIFTFTQLYGQPRNFYRFQVVSHFESYKYILGDAHPGVCVGETGRHQVAGRIRLGADTIGEKNCVEKCKHFSEELTGCEFSRNILDPGCYVHTFVIYPWGSHRDVDLVNHSTTPNSSSAPMKNSAQSACWVKMVHKTVRSSIPSEWTRDRTKLDGCLRAFPQERHTLCCGRYRNIHFTTVNSPRASPGHALDRGAAITVLARVVPSPRVWRAHL